MHGRILPLLTIGAAALLAGCANVVTPTAEAAPGAFSRVVAVDPLFLDQFNRANGAALGNGWIEKGAAVFSISNNAVVKAASNDYRENLAYRPASESLQDVQASVEFTDTYDNQYAPGYPQLWIRVQTATVATPNNLDGYILYIPNNPGTALVGRQRGNVYVTALATINLSQSILPQGRYRLTLSAIGANPGVSLEANVERFTGSDWQSLGTAAVVDTGADRVTGAGTVGFSGSTEEGRYSYDNFTYGTATSDGGGGTNTPPTANFTFGVSGLTASFTSTSGDTDGSIAAYSWNFGDGVTSSAQNPSHTYAAGGSYTVTHSVTDNGGASASTSRTVTVTPPNQAPVVNAGADQTVLLGVLYTLNATFSDGNGNGPWSYTINWGDGTSSSGSTSGQGTISAGHTYLALLSSRTITVTVTDAAGASGSDSKVVRLVL